MKVLVHNKRGIAKHQCYQEQDPEAEELFTVRLQHLNTAPAPS
jgi:hypothetical protein